MGKIAAGYVSLVFALFKIVLGVECTIILSRNIYQGDSHGDSEHKKNLSDKLYPQALAAIGCIGVFFSVQLIAGIKKKSSTKLLWWILFQMTCFIYEFYFCILLGEMMIEVEQFNHHYFLIHAIFLTFIVSEMSLVIYVWKIFHNFTLDNSDVVETVSRLRYSPADALTFSWPENKTPPPSYSEATKEELV